MRVIWEHGKRFVGGQELMRHDVVPPKLWASLGVQKRRALIDLKYVELIHDEDEVRGAN